MGGPGEPGFTLMELIAVMVILAVLAGAAIPAISTMGRTRSAMAARQLVRDLTFARQRAIDTGTRSWVVFDADAPSWSVLAEDPDNPGRSGAAVLSDPATGGPYVQPLGVSPFTGVSLLSVDFNGDAEVGFDWLGRPLDQAAELLDDPGAVTLSDGAAVSVEPGTGHIVFIAP